MNTDVILRRSGWRSPTELEQADCRSKQVAGEQLADEVRPIRSYVLDEGGGSLECSRGSRLIVALATAAAVAGVLLASAVPAPAFIAANTIDPVATRAADGDRIRVSGPIGCTNERIVISVRIDQPATGASARRRWRGSCSGEVQHWVVRASAEGGARFEDGRARVRASALGGRRRWSETVAVLRRGFPKP